MVIAARARDRIIDMGKLFGTDGIRGIANREPITPEMGLKLGRAMIRFCELKGESPSIVIGRDTRASGEMLEYSIVSGILSAGGNAYRVEVLPTPGVAYMTRELCGGAGIVVSASHNPHEYNGFKIFSHDGFKLSDDEESMIEELILSEPDLNPHRDTGRVEISDQARIQYVSFLKETYPEGLTLREMKIVLDCANGATFQVAPALFESLGVGVLALFVEPNGKNINQNCGSQHTGALRRKVLETGADAGLAFDGDGDRLIVVDEKGKVLTGDQILVICAKMLKARRELENNLVVSTVMSNIGFRLALKDLGIEQVSTHVGDRYVMEEMRARKASLGGEESGHIIFSGHHTTGDGILSALQVLSAIKMFQQPLSELSTLMSVFPQVLINVPVKTKPDISSLPELVRVIKGVEQELGERGRVLVRYSGTEPVCRVMVEGEKQEEIDNYARNIADLIRQQLG